MPDKIAENGPFETLPSRRENANGNGTPAADGHSPLAGRPRGDPLAALAETAKDYARAARADNTQRAYDADWRQFSSWLRRHGLSHSPPDPQTVGLYLAACADGGISAGARDIGAGGSGAVERRHARAPALRHLLALSPARRTARFPRPPHIATVLAGIRRRHGRPPIAEGGDLRRRAAGHAGDARHGPARPARPRHSRARLRRRPAPLRDRRPRLRPRSDARTAPAGSRSSGRPERRRLC